MIRYIIFDMDGVLINSEPVHYEIWKEIFAEKGLEIDFEHYKGCIGSTVNVLYDLIKEGYGVDFHQDPSMKELYAKRKGLYIKEKGIPKIEGVTEVLSQLKERGYRLAVASSSPQEYIELCTKKIGIDQYFDILYSAERVSRPKPFPDVFLAVADAMKAEPEECLVIEDSYNGSHAAKAAGMKCLGFANPDSGNQDLSAADRIFYPFANLIQEMEQI
ncbi:MAG: HAD family hydrolase [Ruminococcus sp.]|nr:HAD family hydrolase [Ruminococcus sp.]